MNYRVDIWTMYIVWDCDFLIKFPEFPWKIEKSWEIIFSVQLNFLDFSVILVGFMEIYIVTGKVRII